MYEALKVMVVGQGRGQSEAPERELRTVCRHRVLEYSITLLSTCFQEPGSLLVYIDPVARVLLIISDQR